MVYSVIAAISSVLGLVFILKGTSLSFYIVCIALLLLLCMHVKSIRINGLIAVGLFSLYAGIGTLAEARHVSVYSGDETVIDATIHSLVDVDGDSLSMKVKSIQNEMIQVHGFIESEAQQAFLRTLAPGDLCHIEGKLHSPRSPTNFYQFNYKTFLYEQNIHWIMTPNLSSLTCRASSSGFYYKMQAFRSKQIKQIVEGSGESSAGIIVALVFGERVFVEEDILRAYQSLGVIHLLAVSGLHVGLVVSVMFFMLLRAGITRERALEALCISLPIYMIIAGGAPSVVRASFMTIIVLFFLRFKQTVPPLIPITAVFLLYLALKPFALFQLGFQLSFLTSFVLILSAPIIMNRYSHNIARLAAVTTLAQLASLPLILLHFYQASLLSLLLNLIYIPFISFIVLPLAFLGVLCSSILPSNINIAFLLLEITIPPVHEWLVRLDGLSLFMVRTGKPNAVALFGSILLFTASILLWEAGKRGWWKLLICGLLWIVISQWAGPFLKKEAVVTMLDVGQGDSFIIELPRRREVYVIDAGGTLHFANEKWRERNSTYDVGRDVVVDYLKAKGIRKVDTLILTHGHMDHIGGAFALVDEVPIKKLLYSAGTVEGEFEQALLRELYEKGTEIHFVSKGDAWKAQSSRFIVLSPSGDEQDLNNRSIVLFAEIEGVKLLFTGDLEEEGERLLIQTFPDLQADILKVGHHGSKTSTTEAFITQVQPNIGLISAGRNNRFNHPHPEVTERLFDHNIQVIRTDLQGAVQLHLYQEKMKIIFSSYKKAEQQD
ncbi:DNA internalization-related competence protein ComEC/Rec2 [Alkalihalophilus marmarensis]|uniref:DNA internalization-related competence protein ComEC/Rec2 n=1 Tax=Alkalihalophilus marmarensis TaxID=521377 RepID=UPI002E1FC384|nr:DNA internalization-related competence protein ComEC/Rec2 [Alkalihalophilus marmarensis]MED1602539.1 DNA internalization-related competence protein ComEC/Rec2 [Alkalihalophilus marmarensis]